MVRRTARRRAAPVFLASLVTSASLISIFSSAAAPAQILHQAVPGSSRELKQRLLIRNLILLQGIVDRANQKLGENIELLAKTLPQSIAYEETLSGRDLNQDGSLLKLLEQTVGANPFDLEEQLKTEVSRVRSVLQADQVSKRAGPLTAGEKPAAMPGRIFFRRSTFINPSEPARTIDSLPAEDLARWPGTINILIDSSGAYVVFATSLEMSTLKSKGQIVFKRGQLK